MAKSVATVSIDIVAEQAKLKAELDKVKKELGVLSGAAKKTERAFSTAGKALAGAFSVAALAGFTRAVIRETSAQEAAQAQLTAALKSTGGAVGLTGEQLNAMASELQRTTTFADDAVTAMQSVLLTFTKISGPQFTAATTAVLDMATRLGTDLTSAAVQVGKALNDPIKGVTALGRAGVQFSEDQKALIKSLVETGETAKAQRVILKELEVQFGGSAAAARNTFGGALTALQNAVGDLLEADTGVPGLTGSLNEMTELLADPATKEAVGVLTKAIVDGMSSATRAVTQTVGAVRFLGEELAAIRFGAAAGDVVRLNEELQLRLEQLASSPVSPSRVRFFGKDGIVEYYSDDELKTEIARLQGLIADAFPRSTGPAVSTEAAISAITQDITGQLDAQLAAAAASMPNVFGPTPEQLLAAELMWQQAIDIRNDALQALTVVPGAGIGGEAEDLAIRGLIVGPVQDMKIEVESLPETWQTALERMAEASTEFSSFLASNADLQIAIEQAKNQTIGSLFADALSVAAGGSSKFAKLQQKIALAQAIWYTASGITNALRSVPFPANIAAAAKVGLAGAIQIAKIKATQVGTEGGGIATGLSSGSFDSAASQTVPGVQQQEIRQQATVVVNGNIFSSRETADWFIEQISDAVNNRDVTIIGTGSRQAAELMPA